MRTIVDLRDSQIAELDRIGEAKGLSRAALVRRAVDLLLHSIEAKEARDAEAQDAAFGIWKDRCEDALVAEDRLRSEWEREL